MVQHSWIVSPALSLLPSLQVTSCWRHWGARERAAPAGIPPPPQAKDQAEGFRPDSVPVCGYSGPGRGEELHRAAIAISELKPIEFDDIYVRFTSTKEVLSTYSETGTYDGK